MDVSFLKKIVVPKQKKKRSGKGIAEIDGKKKCGNCFFFPSILTMSLSQLVSISGTPPSMHFGHFTGRLGSTGRTRISIISLPKFNFLSPLIHCTFSCNFSNTFAEIQFLSSFCQITLNSTYNNNKLHFLQFLSKRLAFP